MASKDGKHCCEYWEDGKELEDDGTPTCKFFYNDGCTHPDMKDEDFDEQIATLEDKDGSAIPMCGHMGCD